MKKTGKYFGSRGFQRRSVNSQGMTLVEILVTVGILVITMAGVLQVFIFCSKLSDASHEVTLAMAEAQGKLDEIRDHSFSQVPTDYALGGTPGNTFNLSQLTGKGVIYINAANPNLLEIDVVVHWRSGDNRMIGEDSDLDGILDSGEDINGNGRLDSIARLVTLVAER
ncbi:MAG TPA: hypothetical protein DD723_06255 [Candidatus Omnitrophica bacterium]|nr:MAG: hypothetical protein A2Z81_06525 [Omnitrophica WOR_2 bacterium GWA2_45_18]HBR15127.1 hypothetical protein [Candidatus Omnitrophota bacterium]